MKKYNKEFIIGLCVIIAGLVLFFGIDYLKGINLLNPTHFYYAEATDVSGLEKSAPVTVNGFKVGQVKRRIYKSGGRQERKTYSKRRTRASAQRERNNGCSFQ